MRKRTITAASSLALALSAASLTAAGRPAVAADAPAPPPIVINGYVEANYTLNFNQPNTGTNSYVWNDQDGQFALNLADLHISRAATDSSRVGFFVRLIQGRARDLLFGSGNGTGDMLLEGYGTILIPVHKKDLKVDAGQMVTHVGYETIEVGTNNFFSKSWVFAIPESFYHVGVRATYPFSDKFTGGLYLYNRFNGTYDTGNRDIAPGFSLAYNPSAATSFVLNGLTSHENVSTATYPAGNKQQSILNLIASDQFTPRFKGVFEGVYRWGDYSSHISTPTEDVLTSASLAASSLSSKAEATGYEKKSYTSYGLALYGIYTMKNSNIFALRGDYFNVNKGDVPFLIEEPGTNSPYIGSITASFEPASLAKLYPNLRTIIEYRYDYAKENYFVDNDGHGKKNQSTITIGEVFSF